MAELIERVISIKEIEEKKPEGCPDAYEERLPWLDKEIENLQFYFDDCKARCSQTVDQLVKSHITVYDPDRNSYREIIYINKKEYPDEIDGILLDNDFITYYNFTDDPAILQCGTALSLQLKVVEQKDIDAIKDYLDRINGWQWIQKKLDSTIEYKELFTQFLNSPAEAKRQEKRQKRAKVADEKAKIVTDIQQGVDTKTWLQAHLKDLKFKVPLADIALSDNHKLDMQLQAKWNAGIQRAESYWDWGVEGQSYYYRSANEDNLKSYKRYRWWGVNGEIKFDVKFGEAPQELQALLDKDIKLTYDRVEDEHTKTSVEEYKDEKNIRNLKFAEDIVDILGGEWLKANIPINDNLKLKKDGPKPPIDESIDRLAEINTMINEWAKEDMQYNGKPVSFIDFIKAGKELDLDLSEGDYDKYLEFCQELDDDMSDEEFYEAFGKAKFGKK